MMNIPGFLSDVDIRNKIIPEGMIGCSGICDSQYQGCLENCYALQRLCLRGEHRNFDECMDQVAGCRVGCQGSKEFCRSDCGWF